MSTRKKLNIVNIGLVVLLIISIFLPVAAQEGYSFNFWDVYGNILSIIMILEYVGLGVFYVLQIMGILKNTKESYPLLGFSVTYFVYLFINGANTGNLDVFSFGFWLLLLGSIAITVITILANYMSDEAPVKQQYNNGYGYYNPNNPYGYQPQNNGYYPPTGQPQQPNAQPGYNNNQNRPMYR